MQLKGTYTMEEKNNIICDLETGICGDGDSEVTGFIDLTATSNQEALHNNCDEPNEDV